MNPIYKALIASAAVCMALYLVIGEFLGGTESLKESMTIKSLAHTREEGNQANPLSTAELVTGSQAWEKSAAEAGSASVLSESDEDEETENAEGADKGKDPEGAAQEGTEKTVEGDGEGGADAEEALDDAEEADDETSEVVSGEARLKEVLGIDEPEPPVRAVDVSYHLPENCEAGAVALAPVAVQYRFESPSITGTGLRELELLMAEYRRCDGGEFSFAHNPLGNQDATPQLKQRRLDELKYFFLQHRVPKAALTFPDNS